MTYKTATTFLHPLRFVPLNNLHEFIIQGHVGSTRQIHAFVFNALEFVVALHKWHAAMHEVMRYEK